MTRMANPLHAVIALALAETIERMEARATFSGHMVIDDGQRWFEGDLHLASNYFRVSRNSIGMRLPASIATTLIGKRLSAVLAWPERYTASIPFLEEITIAGVTALEDDAFALDLEAPEMT